MWFVRHPFLLYLRKCGAFCGWILNAKHNMFLTVHRVVEPYGELLEYHLNNVNSSTNVNNFILINVEFNLTKMF